MPSSVVVHKSHEGSTTPRVSILLLDWSCRERFDPLLWLCRQDVPRASYELIWIELYERAPPEALERCDVVLSCGQRGLYHKHKGYNEGLLRARGEVVCICDSDAIFPPDFVRSILDAFAMADGSPPRPLVLMHYEWRTQRPFPGTLDSLAELRRFRWLDLWPNVGACMSVRTEDAIRFGGFDERRSFRGYMCGPYDLGWRLVNAGVPEVWHDPKVALWHFAHENPLGNFGQKFSLRLWREVASPHLTGHALAAVEAFSSGRLLPKREHPEIFRRRMAMRRIGSTLEEGYSDLTGPFGFPFRRRLAIVAANLWEGVRGVFRARRDVVREARSAARKLAANGANKVALWASEEVFRDAQAIAASLERRGVTAVPSDQPPVGFDVVIPMARIDYARLWERCAQFADQVAFHGPVGWHEDFEHVLLAEQLLRSAFRRAAELGSEKVVLFGAGSHTQKAWRAVLAHRDRIQAIADDRAEPGQTLLGVPVLPPAELEPSTIILSSDTQEEALYRAAADLRRRGATVLFLYGDPPPSEPISVAPLLDRG